jgi:SAM-dependent methyltransferase
MDHLLGATARAERRHFWFRGFRAFVTPLVRTATSGIRAPQILDCGCGTGANVDLLGRFGRAYGFDLSDTAITLVRQAGRRLIAQASVVAAPFPTGAFDLVTSFDVLYSLVEDDEAAAAAEMFRLLRPGGYALVNVAALPVLTGDHSVLSRERRRYTRASLRDLLERAGFTIVRITYTNITLVLPLLVVRTFQRWRGLAAEANAKQEIRVPAAPLNGLLSGLLLAESLWLRAFDGPFGSSLLCLARKPD